MYICFILAILQYYLHQLHEIIHYPGLQDVFHCFRELGNAILFFLMIEQSLVSYFVKYRTKTFVFSFSLKKKSKIFYKLHHFKT